MWTLPGENLPQLIDFITSIRSPIRSPMSSKTFVRIYCRALVLAAENVRRGCAFQGAAPKVGASATRNYYAVPSGCPAAQPRNQPNTYEAPGCQETKISCE